MRQPGVQKAPAAHTIVASRRTTSLIVLCRGRFMRSLIVALALCLFHIPVGAEECIASVYAVGDSSQPGTQTASGIPLDDDAMTAAHKSLPFGSKVKVTNKKNGNSVTVTITDRGPYVDGRCIDITKAGARALGFNGLAPVNVASASAE
jgi:rare lipoprotein A